MTYHFGKSILGNMRKVLAELVQSLGSFNKLTSEFIFIVVRQIVAERIDVSVTGGIVWPRTDCLVTLYDFQLRFFADDMICRKHKLSRCSK